MRVNLIAMTLVVSLVGVQTAYAAGVSILSQMPDVQFAKVPPEIITAVNNPAKTPNKVGQSYSKKPAIVSSVPNAAIVSQIHSFGWDSRTKVGIVIDVQHQLR